MPRLVERDALAFGFTLLLRRQPQCCSAIGQALHDGIAGGGRVEIGLADAKAPEHLCAQFRRHAVQRAAQQLRRLIADPRLKRWRGLKPRQRDIGREQRLGQIRRVLDLVEARERNGDEASHH